MYLIQSTCIIILTLFLSTLSFSQPDWVKTNGKSIKYPEQLYLTGFGIAKLGKDNDRASCTQMAIDNARRNLIEKIRVTIQNTIITAREEKEKKYSEYFSAVTQTYSTLEIQGLETENYYDNDAEMCYGFAHVEREALVEIYKNKAIEIKKEIQERLDLGHSYEEKGERTKALDEYLACYPLFQKLEETQAILTATRVGTIFIELDSTIQKVELSRSQVQKALDRLVKKEISTLEDLAWYVVYCLKEQVDLQNPILVTPFTYRDTKIGSQFSRYFKPIVENKIIELAKWEVAQQANDVYPKTNDIIRDFTEASGAKYILRGNYWEQPKGIKFNINITDITNGKMIASVTVPLDSSVLKNILYNMMPENFAQALSDQKVFKKDEIVNTGLNVEIWTDKGGDAVLYTKGERMKVYVRVNRECYVRLIYHLADGKRTMLLPNYYIDINNANKIMEIPQEFECDSPYGAEVLHVFAQTEAFEPVKTVNIDGYDYIQEDLKDFLPKTRGMKKVKPELMQAESRLVVTTMER